jgi:sugar phosphate permease
VTSFLALFAIVGVALYGLPRFYPFFVQELGWSRAQVTSGKPTARFAVAIAFGFIAGRMVDRFGPRRLMLGGIVMAGLALVGLSYATDDGGVLFFLRVQRARLRVRRAAAKSGAVVAMVRSGPRQGDGHCVSGIGVGGALVPLLAFRLTEAVGWRGALVVARRVDDRDRAAGGVVRSRTAGGAASARAASQQSLRPLLSRPAFFLLMIGSMASIGAVGGTMQNLALYLSLDRKLAQADIDGTLSLVLIGSLAGRLLMGWLADRIAKKRVMI